MSGLDRSCSFGQLLSSHNLKNSPCHKTWYKKESGFLKVSELQKEDLELLMWRSGLKKEVETADVMKDTNNTVCFHHHSMFLSCYEVKQKKCNNPFGLHSKSKKKLRQGQYTIPLAMAEALDQNTLHAALIPGQKLCKDCWRKAKAMQEQSESSSCSDSISEDCNDSSIVVLDSSLAACGVSPFKSKGKTQRQKETHAQKKVSQAAKNLETAFSTSGINLASTSKTTNSETPSDESDLDQMMMELKQKFLESNSYSEKIQLLTLKPQSWTIQQTVNYFETTTYLVKQSIKLKKEEGILSVPKRNIRPGVDEETLKKVADFYEDAEYSREMPGAKDYVSIGFKVHHQKRLLLCNLKELYAAFQIKFPECKIGFSKFCSLRPKWCIVVGSSGGHNVCVCAIHQNVVLACNALNLQYKELMSKLVCDVQNKLCMIHRCSNCPGSSNLLSFLEQLSYDSDKMNQEITFQQWESTDRTTLTRMVMDMPEFLQFLTNKIDKLTSHSFIAKCQAKHLSNLKENLRQCPNSCIVLADFAENYSMIVQDAIQGWHWTKLQCTIHPLVLYYTDSSGDLMVSSFCFISDDLNHDTGFVHHMQRVFISFLKTNHSNLNQIHYFSDGCAGQYKNYKNFLNLTFHQQDFGISATWNFFATSHGKSACDGVGGTVKRKLANESLTRVKDNQITTAQEAFKFCSESIQGINFFYLPTTELEETRENLQVTRYKMGHTIPGTRSFHIFLPIQPGVIAFKRTAEDEEISGEHHFFETESRVAALKLQDYVAAMYDGHWWVGMVMNITPNAEEVEVKFMAPHGPRTAFFWPARDDVCWVPVNNVIRVLQPLTLTSGSGRSYNLAAEDTNALNKL